MRFSPCALLDQQACLTACHAASILVGILLLVHRFPRFLSPLLPNTLNEKQPLQVQQISKAGLTSSREGASVRKVPGLLKLSGRQRAGDGKDEL